MRNLNIEKMVEGLDKVAKVAGVLVAVCAAIKPALETLQALNENK